MKPLPNTVKLSLLLVPVLACRLHSGPPDDLRWEATLHTSEGDSLVFLQVAARTDAGAIRLAAVDLDGSPLRADSASASGPFHAGEWPAATFSGQHTLHVTFGSGDKQNAAFLIPAPRLGRLDSIRYSGFSLPVAGLPSGARMFVSLTDTTYDNNDFADFVSVRNDTLVFPPAALRNLSPGPIGIDLMYTKEVEGTGSGPRGSIGLQFNFRREAVLH